MLSLRSNRAAEAGIIVQHYAKLFFETQSVHRAPLSQNHVIHNRACISLSITPGMSLPLTSTPRPARKDRLQNTQRCRQLLQFDIDWADTHRLIWPKRIRTAKGRQHPCRACHDLPWLEVVQAEPFVAQEGVVLVVSVPSPIADQE